MSKRSKTIKSELQEVSNRLNQSAKLAEESALVAAESAQIHSPSDRMLAIIDKASTDPRCNIEKMRALLDMKMELIHDDRKQAYINAMVDAQTEMTPIVTKDWNESTKSYFAKLAHVDNIIRPIYTKHGFVLSFDSEKLPDGSITMFADVLHRGGHTERKRFNAEVDDKGPKGTPNKTKPQGAASTGTILQRKLTVMVFNLTFINEDDDGQGNKLEKKPDRFAGEARAQCNPIPNAPLPLTEAAARLEAKLRDEPDKAKRGEILMKYIKVIGALEEGSPDEVAKAADIRKLAEEVSNEQTS